MRLAATGAVIAVFVLSSAFPHSVEWDPAHGHVVIGGTARDQARALSAHLNQRDDHSSVEPFAHAIEPPAPARGVCPVGVAGQVRVLSVRDGSSADADVLGAPGTAIGPASPMLAPPILASAPLVLPTRVSVLEPALSLPEPPPRAS
jgi:hypothetical protein